MPRKTSIRFFNSIPVRAKWDNESGQWWYSAVDLIIAFTGTSNGRRYWNVFKSRNTQLSTNCGQLKLTASDGKQYLSDCLNQKGIFDLISLLPVKNKSNLIQWINGMSDPLDEQSKRKAYELFDSSLCDEIEIGTINGLCQIHAFLFEGLYDFAGKIRSQNISKGGFVFANCAYFDNIFEKIESMPNSSADEIFDIYIEMNIAHPFMEGNGRATRIWLDFLLKSKIKKCIDWQKIDKKEYLDAMEKSPVNPNPIKSLLFGALTEKTDDRDIFMKGIDYSYYYEEIDD